MTSAGSQPFFATACHCSGVPAKCTVAAPLPRNALAPILWREAGRNTSVREAHEPSNMRAGTAVTPSPNVISRRPPPQKGGRVALTVTSERISSFSRDVHPEKE